MRYLQFLLPKPFLGFQLFFEKVSALVQDILISPLFLTISFHLLIRPSLLDLINLIFLPYKDALTLPPWKETMDEEMEALQKNRTW